MHSLRNYKEIIVFDCETTGLNSLSNHIIELGCCKYTWNNDDLKLTNKMSELIQVNYKLPRKIIELTGITDLLLSDSGKTEKEIALNFYNRFIKNNDDKKLFIAYNANFDIGFVQQMLSRYNYAFNDKVDFLDVLTIYKDRAPYPHRLENAISFYKINNKASNSHRALDDCLAAFEVLSNISKMLDDLDKYINLFGYNPKYPSFKRIKGINYRPQPYNSGLKLYQRSWGF